MGISGNGGGGSNHDNHHHDGHEPHKHPDINVRLANLENIISKLRESGVHQHHSSSSGNKDYFAGYTSFHPKYREGGHDGSKGGFGIA